MSPPSATETETPPAHTAHTKPPAHAGAESVYLAYTDSVFDWGPTEQGYALMCLGIGSAVSNATISLQLAAFGSGGVLLLGALSTVAFALAGACMVCTP